MGLGAAFGSKRKLAAYQLVDGQYRPVVNLTQEIRRIKQAIPEEHYRYITVSYPPALTLDLGVVLDMAAHPAQGGARAFVKRLGGSMELVEVKNTYGGNLTEADWVPVVQELYSVFHALQTREEVAVSICSTACP